MTLSSVTLSEAKGLLIEEVEKPSSRLHPFLLCHCEAFFAEGSPYFEEVNRPSSRLHPKRLTARFRIRSGMTKRRFSRLHTTAPLAFARKRVRDDSLLCHPELVSGA